VQANLAALNADAAHIAAITATGGVATVNVATFSAYKSALNDIVGGFAVTDTVANVQANLAALQADAANIAAITATGGPVSVSAATFLADQAALSKIAGMVNVADTAVNIQASLAALQTAAADIDVITATGGVVTVNVATFTADQPLLNKTVGGFEVSDTAANIQASLVTLAALSADASNIAAIVATGGTVSVNVATFAADQAGLNDIVGGFNISDTSATVQANLAALQADSSHIAAITALYG
jgi:hypothetical protein